MVTPSPMSPHESQSILNLSYKICWFFSRDLLIFVKVSIDTLKLAFATSGDWRQAQLTWNKSPKASSWECPALRWRSSTTLQPKWWRRKSPVTSSLPFCWIVECFLQTWLRERNERRRWASSKLSPVTLERRVWWKRWCSSSNCLNTHVIIVNTWSNSVITTKKENCTMKFKLNN